MQDPDSVMVVAPHPDDESLGCAGIILRTRRTGGRVGVVFLTHGDGYARAASVATGRDSHTLVPDDFLALGRMRQENALHAIDILGLSPGDVCFLGYPDAGLAAMRMASAAEPFAQTKTRRDRTYGLARPDYHSQTHGVPAPYCWDAARDDLAGLLSTFQPGRIYVTDAADGHSDHAAACDLVTEAATAAGFSGLLHTYLIHGKGGTWPWPRGATPSDGFASHAEEGRVVPAGIPWPPDERFVLQPEEIARKHAAIRAYTLEMTLASQYIESFVKSEEIFWHRPVAGRA